MTVRVSITSGVIRCRNDSDETVTLDAWGGPEITVLPRTEFAGNPAHQTHAMLYAITREALDAAITRGNLP